MNDSQSLLIYKILSIGVPSMNTSYYSVDVAAIEERPSILDWVRHAAGIS